MSRELERGIELIVEQLFDADESRVLRLIEAAGADPQAEALLLQGMIERTISAFRRFYENKQDEVLLTPEEVAARYGHSLDWVYKSRELREIQVKVGKCLRWREADLKNIENNQAGKRRGFRIIRQTPQEPTNANGRLKVWAI